MIYSSEFNNPEPYNWDGDLGEPCGADRDYVDETIIKDSFYQFDKPLNPKPTIHTCKNGSQVCLNYHNPYGQKIPRMKDSHLLNTIKYIKKRCKEGITVKYGDTGCSAEDMWYDEKTVYGKEAKKLLNYKKYKEEAISRGLINTL